MADNEVVSRVSAPPRPTITLPPRSSMENIFTGFTASGVSPGPLSLVSSFFSDYSPGIDTRSFSQLLAGAMISPAAIGSIGVQSVVAYDKSGELSKEAVDLGFKQNRPMNLAVARSPLFTIPPGLSPSGFLNSPGMFSPGQDLFEMSHQQALAQVTAQAALSQSFMHMPSGYQSSSLTAPTEPLTNHSSLTTNETTDEQIPLVGHYPRNVNNDPSEVTNSDNKPQTSSLAVDKPVDDGYNWRKYGQKQVKGGEYPRSYYKCTYQQCPVKKKVERSLEGQITEITYKGQHNHELPLPSKRPRDVADVNANIPSQSKPKVSTLGNADSLDMPNVTAIAQSAGTSQATSAHSGSSGNEVRVDDETRKNTGDNGDEPIPKRRNIEAGASKLAPAHKTVTEPRIVVQTKSEVDILDDGFRWRKYGQKVVKGNPHPRSYYKCTTAGCNVRKHVERASTDATAVITTYEGKHTHDLPTARNNFHNKSNINTQQLKPHEVVPDTHKSLQVVDFGSKQSSAPPILQLKEEQIRA